MKIHIFKGGDTISSQGLKLTYTEEMLQQIVDSYNPKVHESPLVFGHSGDNRCHYSQPLDGKPAGGWVKNISREGLDLYAEVEPTPIGEQAINQKLYTKISSSFYSPEMETNPTPGQWALRHIALLGAEPPAIKGLEAFAFSQLETDEYSFELNPMEEEISEEETSVESFGEAEQMAAEALMVVADVVQDVAQDVAEILSEPSEPSEIIEAVPNTTTADYVIDAAARVNEELGNYAAELDQLRAELDAERAKYAALARMNTVRDYTERVNAIYERGSMTDQLFPRTGLVDLLTKLHYGEIEYTEENTPAHAVIGLLEKLPQLVSYENFAEEEKPEIKEPVVAAQEYSEKHNVPFAEALKHVMFPEYKP